MGSGGTKAHEAYAVSPAGAAPMGEGITPTAEAVIPESVAGFEQALAALSEAADAADPAAYADLQSLAAHALAAHAQAVADGWSPELAAEGMKAIKGHTQAWLSSLPVEDLQGLAAAEGFEHPTLVGLNTPEGAQHPLAHWLDPAYEAHLPSKLKIQAKATERHAKLAAGGTLAGLTLADLQAAEATLPKLSIPGAWEATPGQVVDAMAGVNQALAELDWTGKPAEVGPRVAAVIAAENHLARAACSEMGPGLEAAKGSVRAAVDKALQDAPSYQRAQAVGELVAQARKDGAISEAEAALLSRDQQLDLLRVSTPPTQRAGLTKLASERGARVEELAGLRKLYLAGKDLTGVDTSTTAGKEHLVGLAEAAGSYFAKRAEVAQWGQEVPGYADLKAIHGALWTASTSYNPDAQALTGSFRAWAKGQKLPDLRAVAKELGMDPDGASRAQIQNYIAASWDPKHDKSSIQAAVGGAKGAKVPGKPPAAAPKTVTSTSAPLSAGATLLAPSGTTSFAAKHLQVVAALKAHQAVAQDLPARPSQADIDDWSFGPGKSASLGGTHAKTLHAAPDGSMWLFKPDKTPGGARAHAEAAASEIFHRAGVPSVGVYVKKLGGKVGSVQPLVAGAAQLPADPASWSQADVDAIVRHHVAAWAVGDHDGNHTNVLRTPSGGLLPVDQGQAFKFFGRDRLDVGYHPNGSYGAPQPVFHQAYLAAKSGGLAGGATIRPEAALPVIRALERIPDAQYRAILQPVATHGVKDGVAWVGPMRKAAQKRLKKTNVTDAQVAEEFLRHACERKASLRSAFAEFFMALGFASGAKLSKVA